MRLHLRHMREAMGILRSVVERIRVQPGCISFRIYQDSQEESAIMIEELWKCQEDLERHLRSVEYGRILLVVEMARDKPEIRFDEVARSTGLETIKRARSQVTAAR